MNFPTPEAEEKFIIEFMLSPQWEFMKEIIEKRQYTVIQELGNPRTTSDGRAMLNGRLIELTSLVNVAQNLSNFARTSRELNDQNKDFKKDRDARKLMFPELLST